MKHITIYSLMIVCSVFTSLLVTSCNSDLNSNIKDDPYSGGKAPLGIGLLAESPSPESAYPNDTVVFKAKGMLNWCDPQSGRYDFKFYISDEETKIVTATDTTITVKVPGNLSSGTAYIVLKEQVFYGPRLTVLGNIRIGCSGDSNAILLPVLFLATVGQAVTELLMHYPCNRTSRSHSMEHMWSAIFPFFITGRSRRPHSGQV